MCFHENDDLRDFLYGLYSRYPRSAAVVLRYGSKFSAGYYVKNASDNAEVAQAVANLKAWHPGDSQTVDLYYVNLERGGSPIKLEQLVLPPPNMKSADDDPLFASFMRDRKIDFGDEPTAADAQRLAEALPDDPLHPVDDDDDDFVIPVAAGKLRELRAKAIALAREVDVQGRRKLFELRDRLGTVAEEIDEILDDADVNKI